MPWRFDLGDLWELVIQLMQGKCFCTDIRSWNVPSGSWERSMDVKWMKRKNWRLEEGTRSCPESCWSRGSTQLEGLSLQGQSTLWEILPSGGTRYPPSPDPGEISWHLNIQCPGWVPPNGVAIWRDSRKWRKQGSSGRSEHWEWTFESLFLVWYEVQNFLQLPFLALYPKYAASDGIF